MIHSILLAGGKKHRQNHSQFISRMIHIGSRLACWIRIEQPDLLVPTFERHDLRLIGRPWSTMRGGDPDGK
jgi:hypothetical protein